jgi:hypothetical protein
LAQIDQLNITNNKATIREKFLDLPEPIRDWLTSDQATYKVININQKYGFEDDLISVIPSLITRLVVKDLKPEDFQLELERGLYIDSKTATIILDEISTQILKIVAGQLHNIGVDLSSLSKGILAKDIGDEVKEPVREESLPSFIKPAPIEDIKVNVKEISETPKATAAPQKEEKIGDDPVIIHEEKPLFKPDTPPEIPSVDLDAPSRPKLSIRPKPVTVRIEESGGKERKRVVHYSDLKTSLDADTKDKQQ